MHSPELLAWLETQARIAATPYTAWPWPVRLAFVASNLSAALAYGWISWRCGRIVCGRRAVISPGGPTFRRAQDTVTLFGVFLFGCGLHHVAFAAGLFWPGARIALLAVDLPLGWVSLYAAVRFGPAARAAVEVAVAEVARDARSEAEVARDLAVRENLRVRAELRRIKDELFVLSASERLTKVNELLQSMETRS